MYEGKEKYGGLLAVALPIMFLILFLNFLPLHTAQTLTRENGIIESFSALGYFLAAATAFFAALKLKRQPGFSISLIMILLGLRELDFHDKFTTMGIFKIKFYLSSEVGLTEKGIVSFGVILLFVFLFKFLKRYSKEFFSGFKQGVPHYLTAAAALVCIPISKLLDGGLFFLEGSFLESRLVFMEETIELGIPFLFTVAIIQYYKSSAAESN